MSLSLSSQHGSVHPMATKCYDPNEHYEMDRNTFAATALCALRYSQEPVYADAQSACYQQCHGPRNSEVGPLAGGVQSIPWEQRQRWTEAPMGGPNVCDPAVWPYYDNSFVVDGAQYPQYHGQAMHVSHQATSSPSSMSYNGRQWSESTLYSQISSTASSFSEPFWDCNPLPATSFAPTDSQDRLQEIARGDTHNTGTPNRRFQCNDENFRDIPYAPLIYQALLEAPGHRLVLRDIYKWFEANTDKALNPACKGWQNSVRHNLSMNGVRASFDQQVPMRKLT